MTDSMKEQASMNKQVKLRRLASSQSKHFIEPTPMAPEDPNDVLDASIPNLASGGPIATNILGTMLPDDEGREKNQPLLLRLSTT